MTLEPEIKITKWKAAKERKKTISELSIDKSGKIDNIIWPIKWKRLRSSKRDVKMEVWRNTDEYKLYRSIWDR